MVAEFVGVAQFKDERVYLFYRRMQKLGRSFRVSLEARDDGVVLGRFALNLFKEWIRPSYKRYLLENSAEFFFCLGDAYKVAIQYEQIEQIVGKGDTSSFSDEFLSALTRVKFGLNDNEKALRDGTDSSQGGLATQEKGAGFEVPWDGTDASRDGFFCCTARWY